MRKLLNTTHYKTTTHKLLVMAKIKEFHKIDSSTTFHSAMTDFSVVNNRNRNKSYKVELSNDKLNPAKKKQYYFLS